MMFTKNHPNLKLYDCWIKGLGVLMYDLFNKILHQKLCRKNGVMIRPIKEICKKNRNFVAKFG